MAQKTEEVIRPVLEALKQLGPEGEIAVNEIQRYLNQLLSKSGGTITGSTQYMKIDKEPTVQAGCFSFYTFEKNDGTLEIRIRNPQGIDVVLHSST